MDGLFEVVKHLGGTVVPLFWWPVLLWTLIAGGVYVLIQGWTSKHPNFQYNLRTVLLVVLPVGVGLTGIAGWTLVEVPMLPASTVWESAVETGQPMVFEHAMANDESFPSETSRAAEPVHVVEDRGRARLSWALVSGIGFFVVVGWWCFALGRMVWHHRLLRQMQGQLKFVELEALPLDDAVLMTGLQHRRVRIAIVPRAVMPITFGWRRPIIVVPTDLLDQPAALHLVVLHEWTHIRRHDYPRLWIEAFVEVGFGAHPLVQRLRKDIQAYRELACDADVVRHARDAAPMYAQLLFAMRTYQPWPFTTALRMGSKPSDLRRRIQALATGNTLKQTGKSRTGSALLIMALFVSIALAIGTFDLVQGGGAAVTPIHIEQATLVVDGEILDEEFSYAETSSQHFVLDVEGKGIFLIGLAPFDGASTVVGRIEGTHLVVQLPEHRVEIETPEPLIRHGVVHDVFARFVPQDREEALGTILGSGNGVQVRQGRYMFMAAKANQVLFANPSYAIESISFKQAQLAIDGAAVGYPFGMHATGRRSIYVYLPSQELFVLHLGYVEGARHMGEINGRALKVQVGNRTIAVTSEESILEVGRAVQLWGWHVLNYGALGTLDRKQVLAGRGSQVKWNDPEGSAYAFGTVEDGHALLPRHTLQDLATTIKRLRGSATGSQEWMAGLHRGTTTAEDLYEQFMEVGYSLALAPEQVEVNGQMLGNIGGYARASSPDGYIIIAIKNIGAITLARVPFPGATQAAEVSSTNLDVTLEGVQLSMNTLVPVIPKGGHAQLWARFNPRLQSETSSFSFTIGNHVSSLEQHLREKFVLHPPVDRF